LSADSRRRAEYGGLALEFAEAAERLPVWKEALKGWNMVESQQVLEWIAEGEAKGEANALLQLLELRFPPGATADLLARIRATTDLTRLRTWFKFAVTADSLDAFRQAAGL
jgi:hypothetical protein